ncbi:MAG: DNRLRE domain-containing protein, partial [bacterium]|nr:DNRLRE domain-containing protein [bacterium]
PIPLEFWQPNVYSQYFDLSLDSIRNHSTKLNGTVSIPGDTTGVDSLRLNFPAEMLPTVQNWVSIKNLGLEDTNFGIWLRPDTISAFSIRSFHSFNDGIDSLKPRLTIVYSWMKNGLPVGLADTFVVANRSTHSLYDASFISPGSVALSGLQVGSGDAVRGIVWFDLSDLKEQQVIVHRAKMILTRSHAATDFGSIEAMYHYLPYNDSTSWQSKPTLSSAYLPSAVAVTDSTVEFDIRYATSYWLQKEYSKVAVVLLDSWEGINVSRTSFGSVSAGGTPPRIQLTLSRLEEQ